MPQGARTVVVLLFTLLAAACAGGPLKQDARPLVELRTDASARRVDVLVDGAPFTAYLYRESLKKPVLHPLRTAAGTPVTRGFPFDPTPGERTDHPHHAGLWFNYGNVNGLDFWNNSDAVPASDAPRMGTVRHRALRTVRNGRGEGVLEVTHEWVDHRGTPLLREDVRFVFRADARSRAVDRFTTLTALEAPVAFPDDKEGMLGLRVARGLEQPEPAPAPAAREEAAGSDVPAGRYLSAEGREGDDVWGTRARWTALSGSVGGEAVTITIFDHPRNPGFPTYWHARGYGLFAANPLGQRVFSDGREALDLRLAPGDSVTFRHRVLILSGTPARERLEAEYVRFAR
jgi:hypothetical protein